MRRRQRQVLVEVSPTRHEIAVIENGVLLGQRSARCSLGETQAEWAEGLLALEAEVTAWVEELDIAGCQTQVVYTGLDTTASVFHCPVSAGESRAKLAARAAMADIISYPIEQNAHAEFCLFREKSAASDKQPELCTLALADTEATIMSLSMLLERAGLQPISFIPAQGASLAAAIKQLEQVATKEAARVVLWVGEHSSVIAAGVGDQLALSRLVPVGTETFVEALTRSASAGDLHEKPLLGHDVARELLFTSGIPLSEDWQSTSMHLNAKAVLPLLQPALQRLNIELKQSIRFGLSRKARAEAKLIVCGPGAGIRGLKESIASGASLETAPQDTARHVQVEGIHGDIAAVLALGSQVPALESKEFAAQRVVNTTRRAIWVGAAIAILVAGVDVHDSLNRSSRARHSLEQAATETTPFSSLADQTMQVALAARHGLDHARARERALLGTTPRYSAVLAALSALTPEEVSLTEIAFAEEEGFARCTLRGWAVGDDEVTETDRFREFVVAIRSSPLIAETKLGETRRSQERDRQTLSFSMTLDLVELPVGLATAEGIGDTGEPSP